MAQVRCVDGSLLTLLPQPCRDRQGVTYEVTLRLLRDGAVFAEVGERCGGRLTALADRLRDARTARGPQALPAVAGATGSDPELLSLRARDPDDIPSSGDLRLWLREERTWQTGGDGARGRWSLESRAVLDAWGTQGRGVRAVLDSDALQALLGVLVQECGAAGVRAEPGAAPLP